MAEIVYTLESAAQMLIETQRYAIKAERERITNLIQDLLDECEADAIGKPEYYDYVGIYRYLIKMINN